MNGPSPRPRRYGGDASSLTAKVLVHELARRGLDPERLLPLAGLTPSEVMNPLGRLVRERVVAFAELCATATGDPAFHLEATARAEIGAFGAVDFVVTMAPTIGTGISRVGSGFALINSGLEFTPVVGVRDAYLRMHAVHEPVPHWIDVETLAIAASSRVARASGGHGPTLLERTGEDRGYLERFEALVRCPVRYGAAEDRLYFARSVWDARPVTAHPAVTSLFSFVAEPVIAAFVPAPALSASVERVIEERLSDGALTAAQVAVVLGLSTRTFHRRLSSEGTSFGRLVDAVRLRVARRELERGVAIGEVAVRVGFSEPAAFTRAYRRWTGVPPSADR